MEEPTLAEKLGTTTHLSPLLHKAARLGLGHYSNGTEPDEPLATPDKFSDEELAMALLSVALPYDPHSIRCGAAMLSANGNSPRHLAHMAVMERSIVPVRYVAEAGVKYEPENSFWRELLAALPDSPPPKQGVMPHPTRFVAMTGFTRKGPGLVVEWQRPIAPQEKTVR